MIESRYSARIRWLPMDVGIATELNSAGVCQCPTMGGSGSGTHSLNVS